MVHFGLTSQHFSTKMRATVAARCRLFTTVLHKQCRFDTICHDSHDFQLLLWKKHQNALTKISTEEYRALYRCKTTQRTGT